MSEELICEMASIKVTVGKEHLYILGMYRPPSGPLVDALSLIAGALDTIPPNKCICIVGDLNVDRLNTNSAKALKDNHLLNDLLASYDVNRLDLPPTRITSTSISSIDVVCTNLEESLINIEVVSTGLSDHTGQISTLGIPSRTTKLLTSSRRNFSARSLSMFKDLIATQEWVRTLEATSADIAYDHFINTVTAVLDIACPYRRITHRKHHTKVIMSSPEVERLRKLFIEAKDKFSLTGQESDKIQAAKFKKEYDLKLKAIRREDNENLIIDAPNKSKAIWKVINRERAAQRSREETDWKLNISGEEIRDTSQVADYFNTFFTNIAEETLKANNSQTSKAEVIQHNPRSLLIAFSPTSQKEVKDIIHKLKSSSSAGVDDISSRLLKLCEDELSRPLADIINKSLAQGVFPHKLKMSKVYPLHKQGKKNDVANFRPISLIPTVSKIIEKVVLTQLLQHLKISQLLPENQHGFISGKSTITALVDLVENIIDNIEAGNTVNSIFLDLSKAFDCLNHNLLLEKLASLGIRSTPLKWFRSYLDGRKQIVEIKQTSRGLIKTATSAPLNITRGVPQGSVLGPVLFILFTSDLPKYLEDYCRPVMYADDTALLTARSSTEHLEIASFISVNMAEEYCVKNDLVFNERKTKQMTLGRHKNAVSGPPNLTLAESVKHLGMTIDDCLSWNTHIDSLCHKLSTAIFVLKRIKATCTTKATLTAYHALFESHFRYGIVLWGGSSSNNLQRVFVLQKRALRAIEGLQPQDSCRQTYFKLKILTVPAVYILETILYASQQGLNRLGEFRSSQIRNGHDFMLPLHRMELFAKKPSYAGAKLFNMMPLELKREEPKHLKRKLRKWLLADPIYSLDDFKSRSQGLQISF